MPSMEAPAIMLVVVAMRRAAVAAAARLCEYGRLTNNDIVLCVTGRGWDGRAWEEVVGKIQQL